jgi:hypothetical protein
MKINNGKVTFFCQAKGFGFIFAGKEEVFFHRKQFAESHLDYLASRGVLKNCRGEFLDGQKDGIGRRRSGWIQLTEN